MKNRLLRYFGVFLLAFAMVANVGIYGKAKEGTKKQLRKSLGTPSKTKLNINKISTIFETNGDSDINNATGNSGLVYPKGSGKTAVYETGFIWGGKINGQIRVGGSTYNHGIQQGRILPDGTAQPVDDPDARIYRVRPDWSYASMATEMAEEGVTEAEARAQYEKDWNEWPAQYGAPYTDVDGDGTYNPEVDIPGVKDAGQTIFFISNDLNETVAKSLYGSPSMGVEMQATIWAYSTAGPLGSMIFRKYTLINRSQNDFTDMYVSIWSDPDVGFSGDDLSGCDSTLSLAYTYNGDNDDEQYGSTPPAIGFDFFQGPMVDGEATDTAIFKGKYVPGKKNLGMNTFYFFIRGHALYNDPDLGDYEKGTLQFYNLFQGLISTTGDPFTDPKTGKTTKFPLYGDPVAGTGWIDGKYIEQGDRRMGSVSGPFTMAAGDTQEIVVAEICAGAQAGINNKDAITVLKQYDRLAQEAYDNFFVVPTPPKPPHVAVTELDGSIILNWGGNIQGVNETESHIARGGYKFEGYNIYQLKDFSSTDKNDITKVKRIATYDLVNGVKIILDKKLDPLTGIELDAPVQFGDDTGIKRYIKIDKDYIKSDKLYNGSKYYFAVTSYAYTSEPLRVPNNLENPIAIITVTPHAPNPGVDYKGSYGSEVTIEHVKGNGNGRVTAQVIDPSKVDGETYTMTFGIDTVSTTPSLVTKTVWNLKDKSGNNVLSKFPILSSKLTSAPIYNGVQIFSVKAKSGVKSITEQDANGNVVDSTVSYMSDTLNGGTTGIYLSERNRTNHSNNKTMDRFGYIGSDDLVFDFSDSSLAWDYVNEVVYPNRVPFALYRIKADGTKIRLFAGFWDGDGNKSWNIAMVNDTTVKWLEKSYKNKKIPCYEPIVAWQGYDASGNEIEYNPANDARYKTDNNLNTSAHTTWGTATGPFKYPYVYCAMIAVPQNATLPTATKIVRETYKPNVAGRDEFNIHYPKVVQSIEKAKEDVEEINVFPNPYYGVNPLEVNKYQRFVTFTHLPKTATVRIFNLAGQVVKTIKKTDSGQFLRWDLANDTGLPVASGMYIAHIEMPDLGKTKIIKVAIIQEQQFLDRY